MRVEYEGGTRFTVQQREHEIAVDLPRESGGTDKGMAPLELLAASLGTCVGMYVAQYCASADLHCEGMTVDVTWETAGPPLRVASLDVKLSLPAGVPEQRRAACKRAAEHCLVHQMLHGAADITIEIA